MDRSGGVISVIQHITSESNNPAGRASVMNLLNYGLLSVVHAVPGFLSFLTMRYVLSIWCALCMSVCCCGMILCSAVTTDDSTHLELARIVVLVTCGANQL